MLNLVESLGKDYFLETHHNSCFKHEGRFWYLVNVEASNSKVTAGKREYVLVCKPIEDLNGTNTRLPADILKDNRPFWDTPLGLRAINCSSRGIGKKVAFLKGAFGLEKTVQAERFLPEVDTQGLTELLMPQYAIFREALEVMQQPGAKDFHAILDKNTGFSYTSRFGQGNLYINTGEKMINVAKMDKDGTVIEGNETLAFSLINRDRYEPK